MNSSSKVALITGAGSPQGIGFATARFLAQQGLRIVITSTTERIEERARELVAEGADVFALPADLRDHARTQVLIHEVLARHGRLDILVNLLRPPRYLWPNFPKASGIMASPSTSRPPSMSQKPFCPSC
jgi:NAD(P)-dependent dehydrogenase (short-subunit alcohol dehydrogenase family)